MTFVNVLLRLSVFWAAVFNVERIHAAQWPVQARRGQMELFAEHALPTAAIFDTLTSVQAEMQSALGLKAEGMAVQIIVFKSFRSYRSYLSSRIPSAVNRQAIFYQDSRVSQVYVVDHKEMQTDLRHEFAHAVLHHTLPYVPLWVDEGVAEFMEEQPSQRLRSNRLSAMRWKCRTGWSPRLTSLEAIRSAAEMTNGDYENSWAWVHFLLNHSGQSRAVFRGYLSAVSAGEAAGRFSEWTAERAPELQGKVGSYFRKFRFRVGFTKSP